MIFKSLRKLFQDEEYEQIQIQLAEANNLLAEYRKFLEEKNQEEKNQVEPDFLTLVWGSIALFVALAGVGANNLPAQIDIVHISRYSLEQAVWLIIVLISTALGIVNLFVAINLTRAYVKSKNSRDYVTFMRSMIIGIVVFILSRSILSLFNGG